MYSFCTRHKQGMGCQLISPPEEDSQMRGLPHCIPRLVGVSIAALLPAGFTAAVNAGHTYNKQLADLLDSNGLMPLKTALDLVGITALLDHLFAPSNDVFDELATVPGCANAV